MDQIPPEQEDVTPAEGDLNGDGTVDKEDVQVIVDAFGTQEGQPGYNETADLVDDGKITVQDFAKEKELIQEAQEDEG